MPTTDYTGPALAAKIDEWTERAIDAVAQHDVAAVIKVMNEVSLAVMDMGEQLYEANAETADCEARILDVIKALDQ